MLKKSEVKIWETEEEERDDKGLNNDSELMSIGGENTSQVSVAQTRRIEREWKVEQDLGHRILIRYYKLEYWRKCIEKVKYVTQV